MLYSCKPLFDRIKAELKKEIETFGLTQKME